jgi:Sulfotransferase family
MNEPSSAAVAARWPAAFDAPSAQFHQLHEMASRFVGLDDFGDASYQQSLKVLLHAYDADPHLTPEGRQRCYQSIVGGLVGRLLSQQQWKQMPQVLRLPVTAPIIIAGLPRTGTTALHELLACDPQFQELEFWLGNSPMPRPPRDTWESLPQYRQTAEFIDDFYRQVPHFRAIHNMTAQMPEEDRSLLMQEFAHLWYMESAYVPEYDYWVEQHDAAIDYQRFADNLRLIGSNDSGKRWVLKDPVHLMFMGALLDRFPDACIIQTHRDPAKSIPSLCSLVWQFRSYYENPDNDPLLIGRRKVEHWSRALELTADVRAGRPRNFIDIHHGDIVREPLRVVEEIYDFCGLTLGAVARCRMLEWVEHNRQGKHGTHDYDLATFGLSDGDITRAFAKYLDTYGIAGEKK